MPISDLERKRKQEKMRNLAALVGEEFDHFVLIVRTPIDGLQWRHSDATFALGACERLRNSILEGDKPAPY